MHRTSTHNSWVQMRARCNSKTHHAYARYGGRGITVCDRWDDFRNFFEDMGERPTGKTLDRINNDGNYEPANCRWATRKKQSNNSSSVHPVSYNGKIQSITLWAEELGISRSLIASRLRRGWPIEKALTQSSRDYSRS